MLVVSPHIPYSANIAGGLTLGVGMALALACPGTIFPQLIGSVVGVERSGRWFTLAGAIVGGAIWHVFGDMLKISTGQEMMIEREGGRENQSKKEKEKVALTLNDYFGISRQQMIGSYFAIWAALIYLSLLFDNRHMDQSSYFGWYGSICALRGGVAVAASQGASLALTGNTLGSSGAFEEAGGWLIWLLTRALGVGSQVRRKPGFRQIIFASGVVAGAFMFSFAVGEPGTRTGRIIRKDMINVIAEERLLRSMLGGGLLAFGGRLAGGCTSGHGISGMSVGSMASVVSVVGMFVGGFGAASLL